LALSHCAEYSYGIIQENKPNITSAEYLPDVQFETSNHVENERQEILFRAIKQLSEPDRALIALYLDELSYQQIAVILGISENNVGVKLSRIKIRLQKLVN